MKEISELTQKFKKFTESEIYSALGELEKIKTESNRKHLQRLVYVNLVNRFDSLVDTLLLIFSVKESEFKNKVLNEIRGEPVFLSDVYEILLSENPKDAVEEKVGNVVRLRFLNQRHSVKLRNLLQNCFDWKDTDLQRPRIFVNNGSIFNDVKKQKDNKIPDTVIGYADWLYSRRNALVHHDKPEITKSDAEYIKKKFSVTLSPSISLKLSSIKSASRFYLDIVSRLEEYTNDSE
jgi:hypothetical protein